MPGAAGEKCENCKYVVRYLTNPAYPQYQCHHGVPPWPVCRADDWCGEFAAQTTTQEAREVIECKT